MGFVTQVTSVVQSLLGDDEKRTFSYRCRDCGADFESAAPRTTDAECTECGSEDVHSAIRRDSERTFTYLCNECDHVFKSTTPSVSQAECPECEEGGRIASYVAVSRLNRMRTVVEDIQFVPGSGLRFDEVI